MRPLLTNFLRRNAILFSVAILSYYSLKAGDPPDNYHIHPQDVQTGIEEASRYWNISVGQCRYEYRNKVLTVHPASPHTEHKILVTRGNVCIIVQLDPQRRSMK